MSTAADLTAEIRRLQKLVSQVAASVVRIEQFTTIEVNEHAETRRGLVEAVRDLTETDHKLAALLAEQEDEAKRGRP